MAGVEEKNVALLDEPPVISPGQTFDSVTDTITDAVLKRPIGLGWLAGLAIGMTLLAILGMAVTYLFLRGVGIWGIDIPVAWGFAIINFVWWIGIGHAGTLISAILLLFKQTWRNSINRFAEAMTLFAVACAGMFPLLHMGRPWLGVLDVPVSQLRWACGRSSAVRWCGTCSRFRRTRRFRRCSGLWAWFLTSPPCAKRRRIRGRARFTECCRWAGAVRRDTGRATRRCTSCWPAFRRRWCSRCTRSSASISRWRSCPDGTRRSSRRTSWRARFTPALPWCWCWRFRSASTTAWKA